MDVLDRHLVPCKHDIEDLDKNTFLDEYPEYFAEYDEFT